MVDPLTWEEYDDLIKPKYKGYLYDLPQPMEIKTMVEIAEKLSEGFPFVRVDLYNINHKIYFGEMTFTPAACRTPYLTPMSLKKFGDLIL